jgi:hypothetical protein
MNIPEIERFLDYCAKRRAAEGIIAPSAELQKDEDFEDESG